MNLIRLLLLSSTCSTQLSSSPSTTATRRYEVCLSPGCIADGAQESLQKLKSLAPPGNRTIVMVPNEKATTKHRRVKNQKILDLLLADNKPGAIPENLITEYDMSLQAKEAFQKNDFENAASLYERAIDTGFRSAMDLQAAREKSGCDNVNESGIPAGLLWLIKARSNEALARLEMGDSDGAFLAAQAACNIAKNKCADSLEVLAEVNQKEGSTDEEFQALTNLFELPVSTKDMTIQVANKRRELGFRRDKLEAELEG